MSEPTPATPSPKIKKSVLVYTLKLTLDELPVWRTVNVPASIKLPKLHQVIQAAFGWRDSHLHEFVDETEVRYGHWLDEEAIEGIAPPKDERKFRLQDLLAHLHATILYRYDFGDDWRHHLILKAAEERQLSHIEYLEGSGNTPPEDCGGVTGYHQMLEALADPEHEEHEQFRDWLPEGKFDPDAFNEPLTRLRVNSLRV